MVVCHQSRMQRFSVTVAVDVKQRWMVKVVHATTVSLVSTANTVSFEIAGFRFHENVTKRVPLKWKTFANVRACLHALCALCFFFADIDDCLPNPCQNNGVCLDGDGKFTCKCSTGWTGKFELFLLQSRMFDIWFSHWNELQANRARNEFLDMPNQWISVRVSHVIMGGIVNRVPVGFDVFVRKAFPVQTVESMWMNAHRSHVLAVPSASMALADLHASVRRVVAVRDAKFVSSPFIDFRVEWTNFH